MRKKEEFVLKSKAKIKVLSGLLSLAMVLSPVPGMSIPAFADETVPANGEQSPQIPNGDFETWTFDGENLPNNWNSFQTSDGSMKNMFYNANNRQVKRSTDVRPGSEGQYSCSIWSRNVFTVTNRGNLTSGRVRLGATSSSSALNYNYSDRDGSNTQSEVTNPCAMPFTGKPEAVKVWVKYVPAGQASNKAKFSAIIHSDADYIAYNSDSDDTNDNKALVVASAVKEIEYKDGAWEELTIPFEYTNNGAEPAYILINAYTSATGGGKANDYLYIDDIEMVYAPPAVAVTGVTLDKEAATLSIGDTTALTATVKPENATDKSLTWESSDTTVATVDQNGNVTAKGVGTATIKATSNMVNTIYAICTVTVTNPLPTAAFETKEATANNAVGFAATVKTLQNASEITGAGFVFANIEGDYDDPSKVNSGADFKTEECPVDKAPQVGEAFTYEFKNLTQYSKCGLKAIPYIITDKGVAWGEFFGSIIDIIR